MNRLTLAQKLKSLVLVATGGSACFVAISVYKRDERFYENYLMPTVRLLPPETSHQVAILACRYNLFPRPKSIESKRLQTQFLQHTLSNPVGIAAGFDKDCKVPDKLLELGFGFVEVGSVTPLPQPGNPKPRVFRLPEDKAIINRYGFNSEGHEAVLKRLEQLKTSESMRTALLGVNLGKNKTSEDPVDDYVRGVQTFGPLAGYLVVNVSSPNTPGLRDMQHKETLRELLAATIKARDALPERPPVLLKLAPDMTKEQLKDVISVVQGRKECRVDGLIISNTTVERDASLQSAQSAEVGGLSGAPLRSKSTRMVAQAYEMTGGKIPIIGVGGVFSGEDALEKILAGASVVQLYTSFIYHGPFAVHRVQRELDDLLKERGFANVGEAVGKEYKKFL